MNISVLAMFILFGVSCQKEYKYGIVENNTTSNHENKCKIVDYSVKEYILDSLSLNVINYLQVIETDSNTMLSFYNEYDNSIYFYDCESLNLCQKIIFNSNISKILGYNYINKDSIFVYSYDRHKLYLTNIESKALLEISMYNPLESSKKLIAPAPYLMTPSPLSISKNKVITVGFVSGESNIEDSGNRPVITKMDLNSHQLNYLLNYPEQYVKYNWAGGFSYRMPYYDILDDEMTVSFSAHHNLIKVNLMTDEKTEYYAGSQYIKGIKPFSTNKKDFVSSDKEMEWYMTNPSYEGVFYDKYRKLYYRIARLPMEKYDRDKKRNNKPVIVIVLDTHLNYLGEVRLPVNLSLNSFNSFVSKEGFNIQGHSKDEDKLVFYQFKIQIKE